ncbi:hypothetical protein R3P38DRAFT_3219439 [Favolaschia claudopus]|uniref:Uncharacterized protein n=1 Tax=Favolaschia claudopus TaxID=2862362 RepID=A0AAW0A321_9AGAR
MGRRRRRHRRPPIIPPLVERDPLRDLSLPFHPLDRGHHTSSFGREAFSERRDVLIPYHAFSQIGGDAMIASFGILGAYRAVHPGSTDGTPAQVEASRLVRAKLAAVFGVALRLQIIDDRVQLPRIIEERAMREFLEDGFLSAWTATEVELVDYSAWGSGGGSWGDDGRAWGSSGPTDSWAPPEPGEDGGTWGDDNWAGA